MDYIDFLKNEKNMSDDNIKKISEIVYSRGFGSKVDHNIELIYDLFNYIGISDNDIERIILNNLSLIGKNDDYYYKLAYVYKLVDLMRYEFSSDYSYKGLIDYKKMFIRYMIAVNDKSEPHRTTASYMSTFVSDAYAYGVRYKLGSGRISSDKEGELYLSQYLKIGEHNVDVDKYLDVKSKSFRMVYNASKKTKNKVK